VASAVRTQIFSLAINAEAKEPNPGFSGDDTKLVAVYMGLLIFGNLLASKAKAQTIFDCPSGGGFIPWLKIQVAKHLCKVPQQHLDSLNVQARVPEHSKTYSPGALVFRHAWVLPGFVGGG
jgi:hypothetical protein